MNVRQAMLLAADRIERSPSCYNFYNAVSPGDDDKGCMIGWTAHYLGEPAGQSCGCDGDAVSLCGKIFGVVPDVFFNRIHELNESDFCNPRAVAAAMRLYADEYHPATKREGIPPEVRAIFNRSLPVVIS